MNARERCFIYKIEERRAQQTTSKYGAISYFGGVYSTVGRNRGIRSEYEYLHVSNEPFFVFLFFGLFFFFSLFFRKFTRSHAFLACTVFTSFSTAFQSTDDKSVRFPCKNFLTPSTITQCFVVVIVVLVLIAIRNLKK